MVTVSGALFFSADMFFFPLCVPIGMSGTFLNLYNWISYLKGVPLPSHIIGTKILFPVYNDNF